MKRLLLSIAAASALSAPSLVFAADPPIYGVWVREGHPTDKLEFFDCSGKLCAKGVLPMPDGSPAPLILRNAAKTGPNSWKGDLFNPEDGKTYTGKITYESANTMSMSGCLVAFLCQTETWTRVSGPTKAAPPAEGKSESKTDAKADAKSDAKAETKPDAKTTSHDGAKGESNKSADKAHDAAKPASHDAAKPAAAKSPAPKPVAPKPTAHPKPPVDDE